ncbi:MAG: DUF169 domain-containing protein [Bacteroidales bacterium]|nr:DUF169 domain-containing protein [Bacteroidales bacterium]
MKDKFLLLWKKYFGDAELPVVFYYTDGDGGAEWAEKPKGHSCIICELSKVRNGKCVVYDAGRVTCGGAKKYLGYTETMRPGFEYFLSCGNEQMEGERYLRTPDQVREFMKLHKKIPGSGRNIVFKRWDKLGENEKPDVVIFFAPPDVLSGLFTLANFDQTDPNGTFTPFGSGCGSIVYYPYLESKSERQRAVIGMFDPSARKCVQENILTFAVPYERFTKMTDNMEESFLITNTWRNLKKRIITSSG